MGRYADLRDQLRKKPRPVSGETVEAVRRDYPGIPEDYLAFLSEVGCGEVVPGLCLYGGAVEPSDIYDPIAAKKLAGLILVGDDMQGYCVAFDPAQRWWLVEIDAVSHKTRLIAQSFELYVRERASSK